MESWTEEYMLGIEPILNNIVPICSEDFIQEFSRDYLPVQVCEKKELKSSTKKCNRRKKKRLTGVSEQRRAANARERRRNQELNHAFIKLKNTLPLPNVELSKVEILRQAMTWIDHLRSLLKNYDEQQELMNSKQTKTWKPEDHLNAGKDFTSMKHDGFFYHFPDLNNKPLSESIWLQGKLFTSHTHTHRLRTV